ncbi:MAG: hypothetical protein J6T51_06825 [Kiritimatiellae bacterium]|nr:hypothetical protein [Kiritimatiellia bacterium]
MKDAKYTARALGALAACLSAALPPALAAATSEIRVNLALDGSDFVSGERIRGVVDVANSSPDKVSVGYANSRDSLFVEVFRAGDESQLSRTSGGPFVSRFRVDSGEGQKLEVFLGDHYDLRETRRYLAKPVLVHDGYRFEGAMRAFDVVDGVRVGGAMQMFANRPGLQREFSLVYWSRNHSEHLFLRAHDAGASSRVWETRDLGAILRIDSPTISILKTGEVIVLHRLNSDQLLRSELWSMPDAVEFRIRETLRDPETAGTARVREMYSKGGVKPKTNPWWKFW